jgi:hypothetical protein
MQKRRFHSQKAGFEMSAPIGIGVKISAGVGVSFSPRMRRNLQCITGQVWISELRISR